MNRWWISRRAHNAIVKELEDDALLALCMAFADANPEGTDWTERAARMWAEVRSS